jgi:hypothetical protein
MARAVRAGRPLGEVGDPSWYRNVPELSPKAHVYEKVFGDRLKRFQHSSNRHMVDIKSPPDLSQWRHELRHDAESAFWLLLWWVVNAAPADGCTSEIPIGLWGPLVDTTDDKRSLKVTSNDLDPAYAPLSVLLQQLGQALEHDLYWATETPYTHPDFLHEVFQRHILNFIFENGDQKFMYLATGNASRKPSNFTMSPSLTSRQILIFRSREGLDKASRDLPSESDSKFETVSLLLISYLHNGLYTAAFIPGASEEI